MAQDKKRRIQSQLNEVKKKEQKQEDDSSALIHLFQKYSLPYVVGDRFKVISELVLQGKIQHVASEENQYLIPLSLFLERRKVTSGSLLRNFLWHVRCPQRFPIQQYSIAFVLQELKLETAQFLEICYLLGYGDLPVLPGFGKKTIFKGIQKHKTIESLLKTKPKLFIEEKNKTLYLEKLKDARKGTANIMQLNKFSEFHQMPVSQLKKNMQITSLGTRRSYDIIGIVE